MLPRLEAKYTSAAYAVRREQWSEAKCYQCCIRLFKIYIYIFRVSPRNRLNEGRRGQPQIFVSKVKYHTGKFTDGVTPLVAMFTQNQIAEFKEVCSNSINLIFFKL